MVKRTLPLGILIITFLFSCGTAKRDAKIKSQSYLILVNGYSQVISCSTENYIYLFYDCQNKVTLPSPLSLKSESSGINITEKQDNNGGSKTYEIYRELLNDTLVYQPSLYQQKYSINQNITVQFYFDRIPIPEVDFLPSKVFNRSEVKLDSVFFKENSLHLFQRFPKSVNAKIESVEVKNSKFETIATNKHMLILDPTIEVLQSSKDSIFYFANFNVQIGEKEYNLPNCYKFIYQR